MSGPLVARAMASIAVLWAALTLPADAGVVDDTLTRLAGEAAKAGGIIWYESSPDDQADKITAAFRKRFPGLELEHIRDTGGNSIGGRIIQESQGDTRTADVATSAAAIMVPLQERKLIKEFDWKSFGMTPELAPTPFGVATTAVVYVIVYNTNLVKDADAPRTWEALIDPRWSGKLGIWVRGEAQAGLAARWGADKVYDYQARLNALKPVLLQSTFPLAQQVAAGELWIGLGLNHSAQVPIRKGAPIKVIVPDPASVTVLSSFVPSKARNPSGGALLTLWLATPEGAKAYEDATDRGNPFIATTRTAQLLEGRTLAHFPPERSTEEAAIGERLNKMIETRETR